MEDKLTPAVSVKPGDILREELEARGWTQGDLATILGRPVQVVSEIATGKKSVTAETAIALGKAFGTSAQLWLNLQTSYSLEQAASGAGAESVERRARLHETVPVKELIKRGWLPRTDDVQETEEAVLRFLGVKSLGEPPAIVASFRQSRERVPDTPALVAWLRRAEVLAEHKEVGSFQPDRLVDAAPTLVRLSAKRSGSRDAVEELSNLGIRYVALEHLPRTYVDGAAFWLEEQYPVVALSLRVNRIDSFWFTLMHELAHIVISAGSRQPHLDTELVERQPTSPPRQASQAEKRANTMAQDWLIPRSSFNKIKKHRGRFTAAVIQKHARDLGIHPGIVVGRLQHEGAVPYTHFRRLLIRGPRVFAG